MAFPSLQLLKDRAIHTARRFPLVLTAAILGSIMAITIIATSDTNTPLQEVLFRLILTALFGIPLLVSAVLMGENKEWSSRKTQALLHTAIAIGMVLFYSILPPEEDNMTGQEIIRTIVLIGISFLTATFLPYLRHHDNSEGIWCYIRTLILHVAVTGIFTAALFIGMVIIYSSLNLLFGIHIDEELRVETWVFIVGVIGSWFYLGGIPTHLQKLKISEFPKLLKHFVQYILLPLLTIYLVILYTYCAKIIITQTWPLGNTVYLILGFALTGIFAYLALYPLQQDKDQQWIQKTSQRFFIMLIPLLAIYFTAIMIRIAEYGFTENRYLILALGIYLSIICGYFLTSKKKRIFIVPSTLAIILALSIVGPWSMFAVSKASQVQRLENLLTKHNAMSNGKIVNEGKIKDFKEDTEDMLSITSYIGETYGIQALSHLFSESAKVSIETANDYSFDGMRSRSVNQLIGISFDEMINNNHEFSFHAGTTPRSQMQDIRGFDYEIYARDDNFNGPLWSGNLYGKYYELKNVNHKITLTEDKKSEVVIFDGATIAKKLDEKLQADQRSLYEEDTFFNTTVSGLKIRLRIETLSGQKNMDSYVPNYLSGTLLIGR